MENKILIEQENMRVEFRINASGSVELVDFSAVKDSNGIKDIESHEFFGSQSYPIVQVQITGESSTTMHAYKHNAGSTSGALKYVNHKLYDNTDGKKLEICLQAQDGLLATYNMQFYNDANVVRVWTELKNIGTTNIGIEYVSSFIYEGLSKNGSQDYFEKTDIYVPYSSWSSEAQWQKYDASDLNLSHMAVKGHNLSGFGNNRYHYGSIGSWSACEYLPMGLTKDRETGEISYFEIEYSGAWLVEYGSAFDSHLYVALSGPCETENGWWKNLNPGDTFTSVPAAFGVSIGDESTAIAELTKYRRKIRRKNEDDIQCNVVFNDYMNCLMGDPTEENELAIIDKAAELGCEYYCLDCGWYDKGIWWDRVGEWKESPERFPNGLSKVFDYARSKGLKMGLWLEIETMGVACKIAEDLPDDWFFCRHGKRHVDNKRYLLDFRNPEVRKYCMDVVDRMIRDYGAEYFKIDYNVTTGIGSDLYSDSCGDAMLEHYRALYNWYRDIFAKYPNLVIENCGSGGQRMDYGMLELLSLQSTSDQTDYISNSYIAANVGTALTPEQAGMWVYPYEDDDEHVIYNMVNGLLLRPYVSGQVWDMSKSSLNLMKEGIAVYKQIRKDIINSVPFFPLGLCTTKSEVLAYGVQNEKKAYLSVFTPKTDKAVIPLNLVKKVKEVKVIYPKEKQCEYSYADGILEIKMPQSQAARLFEIEF